MQQEDLGKLNKMKSCSKVKNKKINNEQQDTYLWRNKCFQFKKKKEKKKL